MYFGFTNPALCGAHTIPSSPKLNSAIPTGLWLPFGLYRTCNQPNSTPFFSKKNLDFPHRFDINNTVAFSEYTEHLMKHFSLKIGLMSLLATAMVATPVALQAQTQPTNALPPGFIKIARDEIPFHGKLNAINTNAQTITINNQVIQITTNTIITRMGKRTKLAEGAPGDVVAGSLRKEADGKLNAIDLRFAPRHLTHPDATQTNKTTKAATP
jgi:hypothetical protein